MSVDINTKEPFKATVERSDACAVPAASIVCEHMVAIEMAKAVLDKFPHDNFEELKQAVEDYKEKVKNF